MTKSQSRDYGLDLLKIISCFAVVGLHTFNRTGEPLSQLLLFLCGFAIPAFFTVNGYLILRKEIKIRSLIRKITHYLLICFVWTLIYSCFHFISKGKLENPVVYTASELLLQKGFFPHFWFLGALILIYIFLMAGSKIVNKNRIRKACIRNFLFVILLFVDIITIYRGGSGLMPVQSYIPQTLRMWTWLFYFFLFMGDNQKTKLNMFVEKNRWILLFLILILNLLYEFFVGYVHLGIMLPEYFYDSVLMMLLVALLFICFKNILIQAKMQRQIIYELSSDTLGVYILHLQVRSVIVHFISPITITGKCLVLCITYFVSVIIVSILRRMPVLKFILQ